ncbi:MAG: hypothetical protein WDZ70_02335 [Candidatus Paceibacterota bacterium]
MKYVLFFTVTLMLIGVSTSHAQFMPAQYVDTNPPEVRGLNPYIDNFVCSIVTPEFELPDNAEDDGFMLTPSHMRELRTLCAEEIDQKVHPSVGHEIHVFGNDDETRFVTVGNLSDLPKYSRQANHDYEYAAQPRAVVVASALVDALGYNPLNVKVVGLPGDFFCRPSMSESECEKEKRGVYIYTLPSTVSNRRLIDDLSVTLENHDERISNLEDAPRERDRSDEIIDVVRAEGDRTRETVTAEHEETRRALNQGGFYALGEYLTFPKNMGNHFGSGIGYSWEGFSIDARYHKASDSHTEMVYPHVGDNVPVLYEGIWHGAMGSLNLHPLSIRPPDSWGAGWRRNLKFMPYVSITGGIMARYMSPKETLPGSWDFRQEFPIVGWELGVNLRFLDHVEGYIGGGIKTFWPPKLDRSTEYNERVDDGGSLRIGVRLIH